MNHQGHHRHTQYIIANSEIFGFSPEQRAIVAAIARYLGKSRPDPMDRPMRSVPVEEHAHVERAVVLLRLAQALNQDRASAAVRCGRRCIRSAWCWSCAGRAAARSWRRGR
jgi:exopolyphosphatase/guanosine-5'-triphosphate,3'-diphosphate pyrophosphatase